MKLLLFVCFTALSFLGWGQTTLPLSRSVWSSIPTGWTDSNTGNYTTNCDGSGGTKSSGKLDDSGDYYFVNFTGTPGILSLGLKGEGTTGSYSFRIQQSTNGSSWTDIEVFNSLNILPSTCTTKSYSLLSTSLYVRFYFETKATGNVRVDDVSITVAAASGTNTIAAGSGTEPATISSLINTQVAASLNFDIDIKDDGATPATDNLDTKITQMVFEPGTGNDVMDWTQVIAGADLTDGSTTQSGTINATNITFSGINPATLGLIGDDATKNYILKVWLKTDFGTEKLIADGKNLVFRIQNSNITVDNTGSGFDTGQDQDSGSGNNAIDVTATKLAFVQDASNAATNANMFPAVTISADDANGNRDLAYTSSIDITSTGTLLVSPVTVAATAGLATFSAINHTAAGTGLILTASDGSLSNITSVAFDVATQSTATDYFRTNVTSGTWSAPGTWQSSSDNMNWITATLAPNSNANTILIRNNSTITITSSVTIDQATIEAGSMVEITNGTLTIANGTGTDLTVEGILKNTESTISLTGDIVVSDGGKYQHNFAGSTAIPTITWNNGSTCERIGYESGALTNGGFGQSFYNFIWNCPGQTTDANLNGTLTTINGDFTVKNTGNFNLRMIGSASTCTVLGNLSVNSGAILNLSGTNSLCTIKVSGNVDISGSLTETGGGTGALEFSGNADQTFSASGTISNDVDVIVDKSSNAVILTSNVSLPRNLTLTSGQIRTSGYVLELSAAAPTLTSSSSAYVCTCESDGTASTAGGLKRKVSASTFFPVGPTSSLYMPATIIPQGGHTADFFTARVEQLQSNGVTVPDPNKCIQYQWDLSEANIGGSNAKIKLQWVNGTEGSNFNPTLQPEIGHWDGATFDPISAASYSAGDPSFTSTNSFTGFSPFVVASGSALPVELSYFNAIKRNKTVDLQWQTLSESNCDYFGVERSNDGITYAELTQMRGNGTTQATNDYLYTDLQPYAGMNYYRLRQVDFDGRSEYSPTRNVVMGTGNDVKLSPTITRNSIELSFATALSNDSEVYIAEISTGRILYAGMVQADSYGKTIDVSNLQAGSYLLKFSNGSEVVTKMFVVVR